MQIEITGELEELIRAELALGHYRTPEECVAAILRKWDATMREAMPEIPKDIDIDALTAQQGVQPIRDAKQLKADFWPEGENVDDFVADIRSLRSDKASRAR